MTEERVLAEIGQALQPDDDTTLTDGTQPGQPPDLTGLPPPPPDHAGGRALTNLTEVAGAVERLAAATGW